MKNKKKIILILAIISLMILIAGGAYSYAKYFTRLNETLGSTIKRWDIKINNESIQNKTTLENHIIATFPNANGRTKANKIAPGIEGYFDITIDYSGVDVDFTYTLNIEGDAVEDIQLSKLEVDGVQVDASAGVSGTITIDGVNTTKTIRAYVKWIDDATNTLDDEEDTRIAIENETVDFDVQISFVQKDPNSP